MKTARSAHTTTQRSSGFTLIELMITVAIVAILAAVALPAYRDYVIRGTLTDARSLLSTLHSRMEQYYQDNRNYGPAGACGVPNPAATESPYFTISCAPGATDQAYTITAVGTGGTTGFTFTINQQGARVSTAVPAGWGANGQACWVTRRGGSC